MARRLGGLLERIAGERGWQIVAKEVMPDHVHQFVRVGPIDAPAAVVRLSKSYTAGVLRQEFTHLRRFANMLWSLLYFAGSVGDVSESTVRGFIGHRWGAVAS